MTTKITYTCTTTFTYAGKVYKPGEIWEPLGFRNDKVIEGNTMFVRPSIEPLIDDEVHREINKVLKAANTKSKPRNKKAKPVMEAKNA
jgi:hypothetical protein